MKILILGLKDEDGAGIVTRNINEYFLQQGHSSVLVVNHSSSKNEGVIVMQPKVKKGPLWHFREKWQIKFKHFFRKIIRFDRVEKYSFHNLQETKVPFTAKEILNTTPFKPDVILFFWVTGFINSKTMKEFSELSDAKLYWVGTDNAPFTGGCHYPWNCKGFQTDCSNCPAIITKSKKDVAQKNLALKKKYLPANLELIAGSESDFCRSSASAVFKGKKIHKLIAPIDEQQFKPGNREEAKAHFNIDTNKKVIFYGAYVLSDERKGAKYFLEALSILKTELTNNNSGLKLADFLILMAGKQGLDAFKTNGIQIIKTDYLGNEDLIKAYQAADVFVCPSVEDSGPLMVNQAIMCGTPVVSFDTGVAMDIVHNGKTGYRAKLFDANDLAYGIQYILSLDEAAHTIMRQECRASALRDFSAGVYINKMIQIFSNKTTAPLVALPFNIPFKKQRYS